MMPATRESWLPFQEKLAQANIASLAIDLRGHGQSTQQDNHQLDYRLFKDVDHQASIEDARAGLQFLIKQGFSMDKIFLIGASIGANLALQLTVDTGVTPKTILLSPGLNYRGITTDNLIKKLSPNQSVLILSSSEDEESFESSKKLHELNPGQTIFWPLENMGHGTHIFEKDQSMISRAISWL